jgi:hypothetical protein
VLNDSDLFRAAAEDTDIPTRKRMASAPIDHTAAVQAR